ncbi:MAG: TonB-dependent receptor plug domain-containing protein [Saprospiraceae bacterium]|nr:TonB-dependent receptor plug domain-containing protein [Saprospiraceae bacterium]
MRNHYRHFLFILLFWVAGAASLLAQKHTISGYVSDAQSGERLIGATVVDRRSGQGTTTNTYGFFSLTLPADSVYLSVAYIGYQSDGFLFKLAQNQTFNIGLKESALLKEVEIVAEKYERIEDRAQMSRIDIPIMQIKRVPALLGEVDVLKALQLLPGVSGGGEGQSGLYVRGGGPDQNLILLDGVPVYNASHLFGFFSVFNADAIKDVTLTKGGFPARYGGRLSSVIEINMKEGNENELHGEGSIGIISSKLTLEGPIKKGRSSFIVSGRRTYIDILARPLIKRALEEEGSEGSFGYYFYDLNAKANYRFSEKDRLYLSFYGGSDKFYSNIIEKYGEQPSYENEINAGLGWGNLISALRWNHVFSPKLFANTTLTYSQYRFNTKAENGDRRYENKVLTSEDFISIKYLNGINDWAAKIDFDYAPNPKHLIKFGASAIAHQFNPGKFNVKFIATDNNQNYNFTLNQPEESAGEFAAYGEDDYKVTSRLRLNYGLHFSAFTPKGKAYFSLQPRFNVRYLLNQGWALKGGFSTMRQYINLLTNENLSLPTDLWLPSTDIIKPQDSWQAAIGVAKTFADEYEFSVEGYYKEMKNVLSFREGSSLFQFSNWEGRVTQGDGTAYGAEFFVQKKKGKFSGWIGYTLSWAWRQFDDLNFGKKYPYKFDRRHDFEIVGTYKLTDRIQMSGTWVFSTGNAVTFPTSSYLGQGTNLGYVDFLDHTPERNNFRFPSYNRLDFGIDFKKQKRRYERTWSVGAYNAYSRKNPFFLYLDSTYEYDPVTGRSTEKKNLKQVSLFPIIPYISWAFKF